MYTLVCRESGLDCDFIIKGAKGEYRGNKPTTTTTLHVCRTAEDEDDKERYNNHNNNNKNKNEQAAEYEDRDKSFFEGIEDVQRFYMVTTPEENEHSNKNNIYRLFLIGQKQLPCSKAQEFASIYFFLF
jgi:hypothetical protein